MAVFIENVGKLSNATGLFVEWELQNFLSLPHEVDHSILSPSFTYGGAQWHLQLHPNGKNAPGNTSSVGYVDLLLLKLFPESLRVRVNYHLGISKGDGTVYDSLRGEKDFGESKDIYGVRRLLKREVIRDKGDELAPNGAVTFFCQLQLKSGGTVDESEQMRVPEVDDKCDDKKQESPKDDKRTDNDQCNEIKEGFLICNKNKGAHKLANHLKHLLLSKENCDITLKIKNQELQAHKSILGARSSVFSSMFWEKTPKSFRKEMNVKDCDPDALHLFLIYVNTGAVEDLSSNTVFNLYEVANKYDAVELKMNCVEYMKNNLSVETVCDVITHSLQHNEAKLLEMASDFFSKYFKDIIRTVKWQNFLNQNSKAANELLIKASKYHVPPK